MRNNLHATGWAAAACLALAGCSFVAVQVAPAKVAAPSRSDAAKKADALFWATLHDGRYENIAQALDAQTAAYLKNPNDAVTAAHAGFLHIWRLSESARLETVAPTITDDAVLARKYFQEAVSLDPTDARYLGFLGSAELAEGAIHQDEKLTRQGYYKLLDGIRAWPEFNLFTAGYVMSGQPHASSRYADALEWQWQTLDACVGERVSRQEPSFAPYMARETTTGAKRACWNSWIAPHNFEGFFLNMGDMLVKSGDWQTARKIYANARLSPTFATWPFRTQLEGRIVDASSNVEAFRAPRGASQTGAVTMMGRSAFSCVACHQSAPAR